MDYSNHTDEQLVDAGRYWIYEAALSESLNLPYGEPDRHVDAIWEEAKNREGSLYTKAFKLAKQDAGL